MKKTTDNKHELAMIQHWLSMTKRSQAKGSKTYKFYAQQASFWLYKAQEKNNGTH